MERPKQPEEGREKGKALIAAFVRIANMTATWESQCRAALATRNKQEVYYYKDLIGSCNLSIPTVHLLTNSPDKKLLQEERKNLVELADKREELKKLKTEFGDSPR